MAAARVRRLTADLGGPLRSRPGSLRSDGPSPGGEPSGGSRHRLRFVPTILNR
jgi:hypothetical protein